MKLNAINIRQGNVLQIDNKLMLVTKVDIIQPGKGNAIVQIDMKDVKTGVKTNTRFRTQESVEKAHLEEREMQFLYADEAHFTFMDQESFEQYAVAADILTDQAQFLQENMVCMVTLHEETPLTVSLPNHVTLAVAETEPVVKGQTAASSYKPAILENGVRIMVPPHIEAGTRVVVNPTDLSYVERAKD